jgi:hypothetical protein
LIIFAPLFQKKMADRMIGSENSYSISPSADYIKIGDDDGAGFRASVGLAYSRLAIPPSHFLFLKQCNP